MPKVVGIRFKPVTKIYHFDPSGFEDLQVGDYVIVETARGREMGQVVTPIQEVEETEQPLKGILRRATPLDLLNRQRLRAREREVLERCRQKVAEHGLPMKVVRAEYNFDGTCLVFYFTAEQRVDFRELVKDLASTFKTRIELRQIGVRDEAKLLGGYGRCGRPLCCATFLCELSPVSIKMAKQQDLPLNPSDISGICGKLLCCLAYENEYYIEMKEKMPKVGEEVETPYGLGEVVGVNVIKETVTVDLGDQVTVEVAAGEVKSPGEEAEEQKRGEAR